MTVEVSMFQPLGPITVEDWLVEDQPDDGSRLELIWGYLHMTPAPTGSHQYATGELFAVLRDAIRESGRDDLHALPGAAVKISTPFRTGVIPDVVAVVGDVDHVSFEPEAVALAVEVWSRGNNREERDTKIASYAAARVPYLWLVELPTGKPARFWGYALGQAGYRQEVYAEAGETVSPPAPVPVTIDTSTLRLY
jgi:Uma2 family endonuclease